MATDTDNRPDDERDGPACKTCPFFKGAFSNSGECRRHAPKMWAWDRATAAYWAEWPTVYTHDFCGEHPDLRAIRET